VGQQATQRWVYGRKFWSTTLCW